MKGYICLIVLIILSLFSLSLSSTATCTATFNKCKNDCSKKILIFKTICEASCIAKLNNCK